MMVKPWSQDLTWEFVKTNWQTIVKSLGEFQGIPSIVESTGSFCSADRATEVRAFFERNPIPSSQRAMQQSIERIENCVALKERQSKPLAAWISSK
jgi:aminopeptidase N